MSRGKWQNYGRRSLEIYKGLQSKFDISVREQGSVYIASDETEMVLLNELESINRNENYPSFLLTKDKCQERFAGLKKSYCKGALFFPQEITVEPGLMVHRLIAFMQEQMALTYLPNTLVTFCDHVNGKCIVEDNLGGAYTSDKVIICNGRDFQHLFPKLFYESDIEVTKLQMIKTVGQGDYRLYGSILTGLSIRRYESFRQCPSFATLKAAEIDDKFKKWGIHILFKQAVDGGIIIGDSHEYASAKDQDTLGFIIKQEINDAILDEAKKIFELPNWTIANTWSGFYAQSKTHDLFKKEVASNIHIVTAIGGKGMTASAGLAEETIKEIYG